MSAKDHSAEEKVKKKQPSGDRGFRLTYSFSLQRKVSCMLKIPKLNYMGRSAIVPATSQALSASDRRSSHVSGCGAVESDMHPSRHPPPVSPADESAKVAIHVCHMKNDTRLLRSEVASFFGGLRPCRQLPFSVEEFGRDFDVCFDHRRDRDIVFQFCISRFGTGINRSRAVVLSIRSRAVRLTEISRKPNPRSHEGAVGSGARANIGHNAVRRLAPPRTALPSQRIGRESGTEASTPPPSHSPPTPPARHSGVKRRFPDPGTRGQLEGDVGYHRLGRERVLPKSLEAARDPYIRNGFQKATASGPLAKSNTHNSRLTPVQERQSGTKSGVIDESPAPTRFSVGFELRASPRRTGTDKEAAASLRVREKNPALGVSREKCIGKCSHRFCLAARAFEKFLRIHDPYLTRAASLHIKEATERERKRRKLVEAKDRPERDGKTSSKAASVRPPFSGGQVASGSLLGLDSYFRNDFSVVARSRNSTHMPHKSPEVLQERPRVSVALGKNSVEPKTGSGSEGNAALNRELVVQGGSLRPPASLRPAVSKPQSPVQTRKIPSKAADDAPVGSAHKLDFPNRATSLSEEESDADVDECVIRPSSKPCRQSVSSSPDSNAMTAESPEENLMLLEGSSTEGEHDKVSSLRRRRTRTDEDRGVSNGSVLERPGISSTTTVGDGDHISRDDRFADVSRSTSVISLGELQKGVSPVESHDIFEGKSIREVTKPSGRSESHADVTCARTAGFVKEQWRKSKAAQVPEELEKRLQDAYMVQNVRQADAVSKTARGNRQELRKLRQGLYHASLNTDSLAMSYLSARQKKLAFAKSRIHGMGLYACEDVAQGEFLIEYVGEVLRRSVSEVREREYIKQGMGDSYLFRLDGDLVVDATRKGSKARFINHSCEPNVIAKIISVSGNRKIVFYAKRAISVGEEITYDYKFAFEGEDAKITCYCGAPNCNKTLN